MPAMQPLWRQTYSPFGINRTRTGRKWPWAGRVPGNGAPSSNSAPAPFGFHRLDDSERLPRKGHPSSLSDAGHTGIGSSKVTNHSYRHDGGEYNKDAISLDAIFVKKDVSISDAQQV